MALFGHGAMSDLSPLSGVKRKLDFGAVRAAFDPGCVKTCTSQECAELFSLSSSLSGGRKYFWFSNLRNRDGSTRRLNVGVFTRPRPGADIGVIGNFGFYARQMARSGFRAIGRSRSCGDRGHLMKRPDGSPVKTAHQSKRWTACPDACIP